MARKESTTASGGGFDAASIEAVWRKAAAASYDGFRKDACGALMHRSKYGKTEQWGWEIDHIKPVSRGGTDDIANLQPLFWENNRHKGDNWPQWTCKVRS